MAESLLNGMQFNMQLALESLDDIASRIGELVEWQKLADDERQSGRTDKFLPSPSFADEIKTLYGTFTDASGSLAELLMIPSPEWAQRDVTIWRQSLQRIRNRVRRWKIIERYIRT